MAGLVSGGEAPPRTLDSRAVAGGSITSLFARRVSEAPEATAILPGGGGPLTYGALDRRSNQLARHLRAIGVARGQVVALLSGRSSAAIVAQLAVLKAGAAYAPLDPSFPPALLRWMVQDCGAHAAIAARRHADKLASAALVLEDALAAAESDAPVDAENAPSDIACIMYTSGSTGRPKGAAIPHRAVVRLVSSDQSYARFGPEEVFLHAAPLAFDASTFEIWGALLHGARLAIVGEEQPSLQQIADVIAVNGVTTAWFTAGLFNLLVDAKPAALAGLRQILAGGDVLSPTHVQRALEALPECQLINGYGPTENTTFTCCYRIPRGGWGGGPVPIGEPIAHTSVRILDDDMRPVGEGEVGALYAGGLGLAAGYVGAGAAGYEQKFVADPFEPGAALYDTGDLVRRRADGALEFVARRDRQIKIDGKRVEPGEIEEVLRRCEGVADAVVTAAKSAAGTVTLTAYVKSDDAQDHERLMANARAALAEALPAHMRPSRLVAMESFPLTANGKVDHARLPAPRALAPSIAAPDELERALAEALQGVLGIEDVSLDANFFDLGATSLQLIAAPAVIARIAPGVDVIAMFEHANVRALARHLRNRAEAAADAASRGHRQREALRRSRRAKISP